MGWGGNSGGIGTSDVFHVRASASRREIFTSLGNVIGSTSVRFKDCLVLYLGGWLAMPGAGYCVEEAN